MKLNLKILGAINEGIRKSLLSFNDVGFDKTTSNSFNQNTKSHIVESIVNDILKNDRNMTLDEYNTIHKSKGLYLVVYSAHALRKLVSSIIDGEVGANADLNWIDTSSIINMGLLFYCKRFNGDISKWNTSNVIDMSCMFYGSNFNGDISNWNTSNVMNMDSMFAHSMFNKDISNWNISNVVNMSSMFESSAFNLPISKWDISNVKIVSNMFKNSLFLLDISNWDISHIKRKVNKNGMFSYCRLMPNEYKPKGL